MGKITLLSVILIKFAFGNFENCTKIPADFDDNRIYIILKAGKENLRFNQDSGGAFYPFVFDDTAQKLKMKKLDVLNNAPFPAWNSNFPKGILDTVLFNPLWKNKVRIYKYEKDGSNEPSELRFMLGDGFFGATLFSEGVWLLDYEAKELGKCKLIHNTEKFTEIPMHFKMKNGKPETYLPRMEVEISGKKIPVLFDTGGTSFYSDEAQKMIAPKRPFTSSSFIRKSTAEKMLQKNPSWRVISKGDRFNHGMDLIEVPKIKIANDVVGPIWFALRKDESYDKISQDMDQPIDGALGGNSLKFFKIILDYKNSKAFFELKK